MSERGVALAEAFTSLTAEVVALLQEMSDAEWSVLCPGEGWSVGVTAHQASAVRARLMLIEFSFARNPVRSSSL